MKSSAPDKTAIAGEGPLPGFAASVGAWRRDGLGRSGKPHDSCAYDGNQLADDMIAARDAAGLTRADIIAYSLGGRLGSIRWRGSRPLQLSNHRWCWPESGLSGSRDERNYRRGARNC